MKRQSPGVRYHQGLLLLCCCFVLPLAGCDPGPQTLSFTGETMGTVYRITLRTNRRTDTAVLRKKVTDRLDEIDASMSTYRKTSEISRFNAIRDKEAHLRVSADMARVVRLGQELHTVTGGAWDGTVWPLVKAWGFHRPDRQTAAPQPEKIAAVLDCVDYSLITITADNRLSKAEPDIYLDLASIAKGYGVDQISALLRENQINHFIVEIGGEVYAAGTKKKGVPWVIGINTPRQSAAYNAVQRVIRLSDKAVATSGDYRNYFVLDGRIYSHVLDPQTGYPVQTGVVSASVVTDCCALADGLATALMVLGPAKGVALINRLEHTECLIMEKAADQTLVEHMSENFETLLYNKNGRKP